MNGTARPHRRCGFTLLEVMIVVGMAALVMAISIPFVKQTIHRDAVYQAVHVVEDACRNARATAIFHNATTELLIRPQDGEFSVLPGRARAPVRRADTDPYEDPDVPRPTGFTKMAPRPYQGTLAEEVVIELLDINFTEFRDEEEARVRFHPNGTSDEFTIVLRVGATDWRKISLEPVTGIPTIELIR